MLSIEVNLNLEKFEYYLIYHFAHKSLYCTLFCSDKWSSRGSKDWIETNQLKKTELKFWFFFKFLILFSQAYNFSHLKTLNSDALDSVKGIDDRV
jgi:hypothetical protein